MDGGNGRSWRWRQSGRIETALEEEGRDKDGILGRGTGYRRDWMKDGIKRTSVGGGRDTDGIGRRGTGYRRHLGEGDGTDTELE